MQRFKTKQSLDRAKSRSKNAKCSDTQWQFSVKYLPLRRPLGNSPTVWESVRSKPTPFALIILGLWPDWWKKTLLVIKFLVMNSLTTALPCKAKHETLLNNKTTPSRTPNHLFVQHSYQEDHCHDNSRPILPNMHLTPCTTASHTKPDITAVHARWVVYKHWEYTEKSCHVEKNTNKYAEQSNLLMRHIAPFTLTHWSQHFLQCWQGQKTYICHNIKLRKLI